jgi:hypothetical protein
LTGQPSSLRLLRRLRRALRRGEHPTAAMLAAYCADELTPEEDEKIREHFVDCRDCPELLLDLKDFSAPDRSVTERLSDSWVAAAWQSLRARLAREPARKLQIQRWLRSLHGAYSLTGVLLAATCGLSAWVVGLHLELRKLREPQANVRIETLYLSTRSALRQVRVPSGGERFLLSIATAADARWRECKEVRLQLATAAGSEVWTGGLLPPEDGIITLELSRRALPAGGYQLRLQGTGPCRAGWEDYPFVLSYL